MNRYKRLSKALVLSLIIMIGMCFTAGAAEAQTGGNYAFEYYKQQLTEAEKSLYERFLAITPEQPAVTVAAEGKSLDEFYSYASRVCTAVVSDHPDFRVLWGRGLGQVTANGSNYTVTFSREEYQTDYVLDKNEFRMQDIVSRVDAEGDRYTKVRDLYCILGHETEYDTSILMDQQNQRVNEYNDSATGILSFDTAVCAGYTDAFKLLCDRLNVPCIVVGNAGHAWNYVQMEDGKWYAIDLTETSYYTMPEYAGDILYGSQDQHYAEDELHHLSDLYLGSPGDFSFPALDEQNYRYNGDYEFHYTQRKEYPEPKGRYVSADNGDGTCTILFYEGSASGNLSIPSEIDGRTVTVIGAGAFRRFKGFTGSILMPDTVTEIGGGAFQDMTGLTGEIVFSRSLTKIGPMAFSGCNNLTGTLSFPDTLKEIGSNAFYKCESLTGDIRLPGAIESVGNFAFYWCPGLDGTFYLPDNLIFDAGLISETGISAIVVSEENPWYVTRDGLLYTRDMKTLLYVPGGLTGSLVIPEGVEVVASSACENMTHSRKQTGSLKLPSTLKRVESRAFMWHCFTGTLELPEGLEFIGDYAFSSWFSNSDNKGGFTGDLVIPESVLEIGQDAFSSNVFGGRLALPSSLTEIPSAAFMYCTFSGDLVIPDSVRSVGDYAFCTSNSSVYTFKNGKLILGQGVTEIGSSAFENFGGTSITLSKELKKIGSHAFSNCPNIKELWIPESVTSIGYDAFSNEYQRPRKQRDIYIPNDQMIIQDTKGSTLGLSDYTVIHGNPDSAAQAYASAFGYAFAPLSLPPELNEYLRIPANVNSICAEAFAGIAANAVIIPGGVTEIADDAFAGSCVQYIFGLADSAAERFAGRNGLPFFSVTAEWMETH